MTGRRLLYCFFLLLLLANGYIYFDRENGYDYVRQSSYQELYPNISRGIDHIGLVADSIVSISLKGFGKSRKWDVICSDERLAVNQLQPLHFTMKQGINRYLLVADDSMQSPIIIELDYSPGSSTDKNHHGIDVNTEIRFSSIPFVRHDSNALNKWSHHTQQENNADLNSVKHLVTDSLSMLSTDPAEEKIKKIGQFIYQSIRTHIGTPADSLSAYSTYQQFCLARAGRANIWCGNIADIFRLFANSAGLVCREVGLVGKIKEFNLGNHVLNECYIPETGQWAYVDITQNILLLQDNNAGFINTVDLYQLKKMQATSHLIAYQSGDSGVIKASYSMPDEKYLWRENELLFPYAVDNKNIYSVFNKVRRYLWPTPWLERYSEIHQYGNGKFYLKLSLFYAWVLLSLIIVLSKIFDRGSRFR